VRGDDGQPDYHLILADWAEDTKTRNWKSAKAWASALIGSDKHADYGLPTLREQAILFGNLKDLFKTDGYWSSEILAGDDASAWCQLFHNGDQDDDPEDNELRARAVRRVPIE
jgi:hypothetical protein